MRINEWAVIGLMLAAMSVQAADSVTVGGRTTTCTNRCEVTRSSDGDVSIRDCCGGTIRITYPPRPPQDDDVPTNEN